MTFKQNVEAAYAMYLSGESLDAVAERYGCSPTTVGKTFKDFGLPARTSLNTVEGETLTVRQISRRLGVAQARAHKALRACEKPYTWKKLVDALR